MAHTRVYMGFYVQETAGHSCTQMMDWKQGVALFEVRVFGGFVQVRENTLQRSGRVFCLRLWTVQRSEFSHGQWLLFGCVFWLQKATWRHTKKYQYHIRVPNYVWHWVLPLLLNCLYRYVFFLSYSFIFSYLGDTVFNWKQVFVAVMLVWRTDTDKICTFSE